MARSLNSIMSSISSMSDDVADKDFAGMIYSEFGMGKTVTTMALAQALKGDGDILFCDSSDGWVSLEEFPGLLEDADRFRIANPADLIVLATNIGSGKLKSTRKRRYTVVLIDEVSSVFDAMLENYLREKHGLSPDDPMPEAEGREYGPPTMALESMIRKFHDISGVHLLLTAHAREVGETKELRPSFPPKAYAVVMRKLHVCGALSARRKRVAGGDLTYERSIQLLPSAAVSAKSRIPGSPLKVDPFELIELVTDWVESEHFVADTQGKADGGIVEVPDEEPEELEGDDIEFDADEVAAQVTQKKPAPKRATRKKGA